MKNVFVAFLFCLTSSIANAQIGEEFRQLPKNLLCGPVEILFKALADKEINEKPIWTGKDDSGRSDYAVFVNPKTGAFTIIQFGKEIGCIMGIGNKSESFKLPSGLQL